jgi:protein-tyrosine phosphatase
MCHRVYPITKRIAIGRFATPDCAYYLLENGYTHVLNVSEAASIIRPSASGFRQVIDHRIEDLLRIPDETARSCLDTLHEILQADGSRVYLHCIACRNRSPTILWLYLLACGVDDQAAQSLITERCPDAVPGHGDLADDRLMELVREHGRRQFLPLHDPATIEPAY